MPVPVKVKAQLEQLVLKLVQMILVPICTILESWCEAKGYLVSQGPYCLYDIVCRPIRNQSEVCCLQVVRRTVMCIWKCKWRLKLMICWCCVYFLVLHTSTLV